MFDAAKVIRFLGYILYTILWIPVIIVCLIVIPFMWVIIALTYKMPIKTMLKDFSTKLKLGIQHDINFIKTGQW